MINCAKILPLTLVMAALFHQQALAASILNRISLTEEKTAIQIFLRFSELPTFKIETYEKRIDLLLDDTVAATDLVDLNGDDKMIRMVKKKQAGQLLISFYFRYPPQNVKTRDLPESSSLMLDVLLGNPFSSRYPDLSAQLHGITLLNRDEIDYTNPLHASTYGDDWKLFIEYYESPVNIQPKQQYTLPPFPLAALIQPQPAVNEWLPEKIGALAEQKEWEHASSLLRDQLELEDSEDYRKRLLLTYAECLVRGGEYQEPYRLLQQISHSYPDTELATDAKLLFLYLTASREDPYMASIELTKLMEQDNFTSPFIASLNIFQAELALETDRIDDAVRILQRDNIVYQGEAVLIRLLRQADSYYESGDLIKALVAYQKLNSRSTVVDQHPASLARFCDVLYTHKHFKEAASKYQVLVELLSGSDLQNLAMFRQVMSRQRNGEKWSRVFPLLSRIQDIFPGTEGAYRALIRQTDLFYLDERMQSAQAASKYGKLGVVANRTELREEALVKQAMVNDLAGNYEQSIQQAMDILRDFRNGNLTVETKALILSRLSGVLAAMIAERRYIDALVLAKQNRLFFARGWLSSRLLFDLGVAYAKLGMYDRAVRVYQYILDVSSGEERENVYVPMLTALFNDGQYTLVDDYADQYLLRYPNGPGAAEVFLLRLRALQKRGNYKSALRLLNNPQIPLTPEIKRVAARLYFDQNQWSKVIELLSDKQLVKSWTGGEYDYLLAESLFQSGQLDQARSVLQRLREEEPYVEQAMFRLAEIDLQQGNPESALKQFQQLTEKGKDSRWINLAREEITILQLTQKLKN